MVATNNWYKATSEEIKKHMEISKLKKDELQLYLAKSLVKLDKIEECISQAIPELEEVAVVDDGTYSQAKETYERIINILKDKGDGENEE